MSQILVTGGLGFIGSNFVRYLIRNRSPWEIVNLDSMSLGASSKNIGDLSEVTEYRFVRGDIADTKLVSELVPHVKVIVNFAAETHVDRSISNPGSFVHSNILGTFNLLEEARRNNVKFIQISTDEVYGPASGAVSFRENDRLNPSSPYAASKAAAEMLVQAYHTTYQLSTMILRCTNNFGPRQFPEKFIPKTIISALLGRKIPIYGSGTQVRDWLYVIDFCKAIDLAIRSEKTGHVYNVSANSELQNLEVAKQILQRLNKPVDLIQHVEDRPGHDYRYSLDSSPIRSELGWKPDHPFNEALSETIEWYLENEPWWRPLISDKILSPTPWKESW